MDVTVRNRDFDPEPQPSMPAITGSLYVRSSSHLKGPFPVAALRALQTRGEILPDTLVSPDRLRWVTASSLPELFPAGLFVRTTPTCDEERLWHVMIEGQRQGPMSWDSLCVLATSGKLRAFDRVTVDGGNNWIPAERVSGLTICSASDLARSSSSSRTWMIGAGIASTVLLIVPAFLMLIWNERRIGWDETRFEIEDTQSHTKALNDTNNATEISLQDIRSQSEVEAARLNALATGANIEREQKQHEEILSATQTQTNTIHDASENARQAAEESRRTRDALNQLFGR